MSVLSGFVPTKTAAKILNVHPETLRDWSRRGLYNLPAPIRMGSRLLWDVAELYAWIESRKRQPVGS
ncbi:helix-turn-helix transcriptional regulator [Mycobacteroides chelonae]|nr:helix-turn-helix domain-containing protein [Mycobacteroides chelonae]MEC4842632.1 helix-turn-helix domain-containing protein [Mycobacteroides chelonae]MEC4847473.1 helix-turn-helix domain-containing protein [Mycobacteroides chelonae]